MKHYPVCLTIAGSDSSGGAGIQADLKTMSALGVYGMSVITAITAQNTKGVTGVHPIPSEMVGMQLEAVLSDIHTDAIKLGMLHNKACVEEVIKAIDRYSIERVVLDPVMISTSGHRLIEEECISYIQNELFLRATIVTPNTDEAQFLTGIAVDDLLGIYSAGEELIARGCRAVLMKGGHLKAEKMTDVLFQRDCKPIVFVDEYIETPNTHGTGCTLSSAIASFLALGDELAVAVERAKRYISCAIVEGADVELGSGHGPVNHLFGPHPLMKR